MLPPLGFSELTAGVGGGGGRGTLISGGLSTIAVFVIESASPSAGAVAVLEGSMFRLSSDGTFFDLTLFMDWVEDFLRT